MRRHPFTPYRASRDPQQIAMVFLGVIAVAAIIIGLFWFHSTHHCVKYGQGLTCTGSGRTMHCRPTRECVDWEPNQ